MINTQNQSQTKEHDDKGVDNQKKSKKMQNP